MKNKVRVSPRPVCGEKSTKISFDKQGHVIRSCGDSTREKR